MEKRITHLEVQKKNKNRVSVYLDDSYAFSVSVFSAALLSTGQMLSENQIDDLKKADELEMAYSYAIRFLGYRARSEAEIRHYLKGKKISKPAVDHTVTRLTRETYINDREFSGMWIDSRSRFNPKGAWALKKELTDKGIDEDIIDEDLDRYDETEAAFALILKKMDHWKKLDALQLKKKIYGFLSQRGFSYETTQKITDRILDQNDVEFPHD